LRKTKKSLNQKMSDIEKYVGSLKESISKRFEKHEDNFKILFDRVKSIEATQNEHKKRSRDLTQKAIKTEDGRNQDEKKI
jgi:hypothetical protein